MSPLWFVAVSVCRRSGCSPSQPVAVSVRLKWMSPLWFVAVPVCRRFSQSPIRFVAVLTHPLYITIRAALQMCDVHTL